MKISFILFSATLFLASCVTFKQYDRAAKAGKEPGNAVFVEKNDGSIVKGENLKEAKKNYRTVKGVIIDGNKVPATDIAAFQANDGYYKIFGTTLVRRMRKGKINLYHYDAYTYAASRGDRGYTDHWVYEKGNSGLQELNLPSLAKWLEDNPSAYAKFKSAFVKGNGNYRKTEIKLESILSVIDSYNK